MAKPMHYEFDWSVLWKYRGALTAGLWYTLYLFFVSTFFSIVIGTIVGIFGASQKALFNRLAEYYVEGSRNTPLIVKVFFLYFGLGFSELQSAIIGLSLHQSAYMAEVIRSGIQSISAGQTEAGLSSGMTRFQVMWRIILPQTGVVVLPPMTTQVAEVLKNTPIAMTVSIQELTFQIQQIETETFRGFEAATAATCIYLALIILIAAIANVVERAFGAHRARHGPVEAPVGAGA